MVTYLGSLVQSCCREGGTLQTNITGVCGECSQCLSHTGFAPAHGVCAFPVYTAQAPGCSVGELSKAGPGLHALPRSMPLRFRFLGIPQRRRLSWARVLCLPRSKQLRRPGVCRRTVFRCSVTSPLPVPDSVSAHAPSDVPCVSSGELISGCGHPGGCQPSRISGSLWLETGSLFAVW